MNQDIREIFGISPDPRIHVFRRTLSDLKEYAGMEVDAYLVLGERHAIMFDTLLCPADMAYIMDLYAPEIAKRQLICVNSHADWDHAWGNGYFGADVPIIVHKNYLRSSHYIMANEELAGFQARTTLFRDVKIFSPTITFSENLTLIDGQMTIELQYAPGHCDEHIVAWFPDIKLLLAFDAVEYPLPH